MQVQIKDEMKFAFAEQATKENLQSIADAIIEYSGCELDVKIYENEIDIDNQTFFCVDIITPGDWVVINKSLMGYFIYPTEEQMLGVWEALKN